MTNLKKISIDGNTDYAFGWFCVNEAKAWRIHGCTQVAAE